MPGAREAGGVPAPPAGGLPPPAPVRKRVPLWLRTLAFTAVFPGTVAGVIPWLLAGGTHAWPLALGPARWVGAVVLAGGVLVYVLTAWQFGATGHGTPAPWDAPTALVGSGLHAWVRNPMYQGVLLCIVGEALLAEAGALLAYAAVAWVVFHLRVITHEEPALRRQFGPAYEAYLCRVPRWLPRRPQDRAQVGRRDGTR